jgi:catechol 2,3-dioxygenase-like lactoylglutathione lyase family enzyme
MGGGMHLRLGGLRDGSCVKSAGSLYFLGRATGIMATVTIFATNMDTAVLFYREIPGMKVVQRFGDHWAWLVTENGMKVGLHPASDQSPAGRKGSITIGFEVPESIHNVVAAMEAKGVKFVGAGGG